MAVKDIIGQERAINILQGCIVKNRIPHAMLFAGDEGIGKKLTAINFAKTLNCIRVNSYESGVMGQDLFDDNSKLETQTDSCGKCPSCVKIDKGNHPDVFIIGPEGDGGQIKVSVIRELERAFSYKPFEGNYKVAIIDNAETMNGEAANAFLDTLEAPPSQSILILISSRPDMLLPTIRSRCQRISFTPLPIYKITDVLQKKFKDLGHERLLLLSILSGGKLGHALNEDLIAQRDRSFNILQLMLNSFEEDSRDNKTSIEEWLDWVQLWLRDMAVFKATERADLLINKDREGEIKDLSETATLKDILKLARELYNIRTNLKFNLNEKLTLNYTSLLMRKRLGKK
jgi:DNA polymerase-3 subunit delta'